MVPLIQTPAASPSPIPTCQEDHDLPSPKRLRTERNTSAFAEVSLGSEAQLLLAEGMM